MKILFVNTLYFPNRIGGAEFAVSLLAESLVAAGHQAVVVSLAPDGKAATGEVRGVTTHYLPLWNLFFPTGPRQPGWRRALWQLLDAYNPVMGRRLERIVAKEKPDLAHCANLQGFSVAAWAALKRQGVPILQELHDYYLGCPRSAMFRDGRNCQTQCLDCRVVGWPRRQLSRQLAEVAAVSQRVLARLEDTGLFAGVPGKAVTGNCHRPVPVPPPRADLPPGAPIRFGYLGRLENLKGLDLLLQAMRRLPPDRASLTIAGKGSPDYEAALRQACGAADVRFLGFVEPGPFFGAIDMLVTPSVWEDPLPLVVHEAMAHGVPVLGADLGGIPEMIQPGRTGYLFRGGDAGALYQAMADMTERGLPSAALSHACRARSADFDQTVLAGRFLDIWQQLGKASA